MSRKDIGSVHMHVVNLVYLHLSKNDGNVEARRRGQGIGSVWRQGGRVSGRVSGRKCGGVFGGVFHGFRSGSSSGLGSGFGSGLGSGLGCSHGNRAAGGGDRWRLVFAIGRGCGCGGFVFTDGCLATISSKIPMVKPELGRRHARLGSV
eukprot:1395225-Amorphochlora_amoeboformis.AAC.1